MNTVTSVLITPGALDTAAITRHIANPSAGGLCVFVGCTRSERRADGVELVALDYEAYHAMAESRLRAILADAAAEWPIINAIVHHRVGRVALSEPSVVVAVATPHRAAAFEACRFMIDALKRDVPIWKREIWADGPGEWVDPATRSEVRRSHDPQE